MPRTPVPSLLQSEGDVDAARRLLLRVGIYTAPAILATALTATNAYASGLGNGDNNQNGNHHGR